MMSEQSRVMERYAPYRSLREPRAHQAEALDRIHKKQGFALLMARRTGKTKVIADEWGRSVLARETVIGTPYKIHRMRDLLVIAPGGVYRTWREALTLDLDPRLEVRFLTWDSETSHFLPFQHEEASFLAYEGSRVLIVNAEALSIKGKLARKLVQRFVGPGCTAAIDESVIIKNRQSNVSRFCLEVVAPAVGRRFILTGLVSPRDPLDVYAQFQFVSPRVFSESFPQFRARYADVEYVCSAPDKVIAYAYRKALRRLPPDDLDRQQVIAALIEAGGWVQCRPVIKAWKNLDDLHARIAPWSYRIALSECYDMPASDYSFRDVEMTDEQRAAYEEMRVLARIELQKIIDGGGTVTANQVVVQMLRMHQILCGHLTNDDGSVVHFPERRTDELLALLEDYDGKAIIWFSYKEDLARARGALSAKYGKGSLACFYGGNLRTREDDERRFKDDPECRWMLATPDAGGRGRTWDCADLVIYYSQRNNLDHRLQSEDRARNVGKTRPVAYVDMRVPGTVEDKIIGALRGKMDLSAAVEGTDPLEWLV